MSLGWSLFRGARSGEVPGDMVSLDSHGRLQKPRCLRELHTSKAPCHPFGYNARDMLHSMLSPDRFLAEHPRFPQRIRAFRVGMQDLDSQAYRFHT